MYNSIIYNHQKLGKNSNVPQWVNGLKKKKLYIHIMVCYSAMKRNKLLMHVVVWMNPKYTK